MPVFFIYPIYTLALVFLVFFIVPRKEIRILASYSIFLGGIIDICLIIIVTHLLGIGGYINYGPFGSFGMPFFPPISWVAYFTLFFYFLPR